MKHDQEAPILSVWPPAPDTAPPAADPPPVPSAFTRMGGFLVSLIGQAALWTIGAVANLQLPVALSLPVAAALPHYWLRLCATLLVILMGVGWSARDIQHSWLLLKRRGYWADSGTFLLGFTGIGLNLLPFCIVGVAVH